VEFGAAFKFGPMDKGRISAAHLAIAEAEAAYKKSFDQLTIFTQRASENVQDIIADNLISGFDEGVEGMLKSFARMIQEMLAQAIAADIAKALFGGEGVGSGGGFFGFVRDLFGGGRAAGGPVAGRNRWSAYWMRTTRN